MSGAVVSLVQEHHPQTLRSFLTWCSIKLRHNKQPPASALESLRIERRMQGQTYRIRTSPLNSGPLHHCRDWAIKNSLASSLSPRKIRCSRSAPVPVIWKAPRPLQRSATYDLGTHDRLKPILRVANSAQVSTYVLAPGSMYNLIYVRIFRPYAVLIVALTVGGLDPIWYHNACSCSDWKQKFLSATM
jgi:hypothetical protein